MTEAEIEADFRWLRSLVGPNVTEITWWTELDDGRRVVRFTGATDEQLDRARTRLGLRQPFITWDVRA